MNDSPDSCAREAHNQNRSQAAGRSHKQRRASAARHSCQRQKHVGACAQKARAGYSMELCLVHRSSDGAHRCWRLWRSGAQISERTPHAARALARKASWGTHLKFGRGDKSRPHIEPVALLVHAKQLDAILSGLLDYQGGHSILLWLGLAHSGKPDRTRVVSRLNAELDEERMLALCLGLVC